MRISRPSKIPLTGRIIKKEVSDLEGAVRKVVVLYAGSGRVASEEHRDKGPAISEPGHSTQSDSMQQFGEAGIGAKGIELHRVSGIQGKCVPEVGLLQERDAVVALS